MTDVISWGESSPEDPFDDDSWESEPESVCNNWRGWKKTTTTLSSSSISLNHNNNKHQINNNNSRVIFYPDGSNLASNLQNTSNPNGHLSSSSAMIGRNCMTPGCSSSSSATAAVAAASAIAVGPYWENNEISSTNETDRMGSSSHNNININQRPSTSTLSSSQQQQHNHQASSLCHHVMQSQQLSEGFTLLSQGSAVTSLTELAARVVACHISFEVVERVCSPVPEQLQLRIAYWSFPDNEEDIRLYSCLANGSADEFVKGETMYRSHLVHRLMQIGFHLSANVVMTTGSKVCTVAVTFDRCRITSCSCTCASTSSWCSHVVAMCLHRIYQPNTVTLRAPVSESLTRLSRDQLQKFAQYLISESPQQILPAAQRLLDDLLLNENSDINKVCGAPDPTAGAPANEQTKWCLDETKLHENIRKIVIKLCIPSPMVYSDVNYLSSAAPPAATEWSSLLRPLRGREPEGLWNLLSIVREMLRRHDRNAVPLLKILTEELLSCDQILFWWFNTNVSLHRGYPPSSSSLSNGGNGNNGGGGSSSNGNRSMHCNIYASQHACSSLCDEIVVLWRLVTLNPALSEIDTQVFYHQMRDYHIQTLSVISRFNKNCPMSSSNVQGHATYHRTTVSSSILSTFSTLSSTSDMEVFTGFKPAMISIFLDWNNYPIPGVTHQRKKTCYYANTSASTSLNVHQSSTSAMNSTSTSSLVTTPHTITGTVVKPITTIWEPNFYSNSNEINLSKRKVTVSGSQIDKDNNDDSEDSGNQEFWERTFSSTSSCDEDNVCVDSQRSLNRETGSPPNEDQPKSSQNENQPQQQQENLEESQQQQQQLAALPSNQDKYHIYIYGSSGVEFNKIKNVNKNGDDQHQGEQSSDSFNNGNQDFESLMAAATRLKPLEDEFEILFARAEALYAHGYVDEACRLSVQLAQQMLVDPPVLQLENANENNNNDQQRDIASLTQQPNTQLSHHASSSSSSSHRNNHTKRMNRNRFNPTLHRISLFASGTLSKAAFLCQVLLENEKCHLLAFRIGLFGLELVRSPASTKALEVKLAYQEQELANLLKRIPLCQQSLAVLLEKAENLRDGHLTTRGEALLPLTLASYVFEALVLNNPQKSFATGDGEKLVFEAAVAAIGLKANISEADHPLLCEGTRRQRGELALTLLLHYKDNKARLDKIMDKLLDKEIHQIHRKPPPSASLITGGQVQSSSGVCGTTSVPLMIHKSKSGVVDPQMATTTALSNLKISSPVNDFIIQDSSNQAPNDEKPAGSIVVATNNVWNVIDEKLTDDNQTRDESNVGQASSSQSTPETNVSENSTSTAAATSSDSSPTILRRFESKNDQKTSPSDTGSGGESSSSSSDSFSTTSSSGMKTIAQQLPSSSSSVAPEPAEFQSSDQNIRTTVNNTAISGGNAATNRTLLTPNLVLQRTNYQGSPPTLKANPNFQPSVTSVPIQKRSFVSSNGMASSSVSCFVKNNQAFKHRYKNKRQYPNVPNQPSEASAHFMFELAKTLLSKAGGNNTTVLFTQPPSSQNGRSSHRLLHMCAFQIGLYALGLHNAVSPNWLSRTYSSHVSWITCQAMEIGHQAIEFLIDTWEGHLTPTEVASLADRASRAQDSLMIKAAANLALSCLPHAQALTPNEIQRALIQCKEQSTEMLERACLAIESSAQGGGVNPEVLFEVARKWYEMYENEKMKVQFQEHPDRSIHSASTGASTSSSNNGFEQQQPVIKQLESLNESFQHSNEQALVLAPTLQQDIYDVFGQGMEMFCDPQAVAIDQSYYPMAPSVSNQSGSGSMSLPLCSTYYTHSHQAHHYANETNQIGSNGSSYTSPSIRFYPGSTAYQSVALKLGNLTAYADPNGRYPPMVPSYPHQFYSTTNNNSNTPMSHHHQQQQSASKIMLPPYAPATSFYGYQQGSVVGQQSPLCYQTPYSVMRAHFGHHLFAPLPMASHHHHQSSGASNMLPYNGPSQAFPFSPTLSHLFAAQHLHPTQSPSALLSNHNAVNGGSPATSASAILDPRQLGYMHAAYRVGMLAMETLSRRVNDDRPQTRFSRNPSYGEDVKWLLCIAKKLGSQFVQEFCVCTLTAVASPFILYDIIIEAAQSITHNVGSNNSTYIQTIRSQILTPLIQKCSQMFSNCIYFQITHLIPSDYEEFISTLRMARAAFHMLPGGAIHFIELLQSVKRTKSCKKELWQLIQNSIQT